MRIDALEDQETGFQCGDADDNDEGRYILFYFSLAKFAWYLMRKLKKIIGGIVMKKSDALFIVIIEWLTAILEITVITPMVELSWECDIVGLTIAYIVLCIITIIEAAKCSIAYTYTNDTE